MAFQLRHCVIHELVKESGKQRVEAIIKQVLPTECAGISKISE